MTWQETMLSCRVQKRGAKQINHIIIKCVRKQRTTTQPLLRHYDSSAELKALRQEWRPTDVNIVSPSISKTVLAAKTTF